MMVLKVKKIIILLFTFMVSLTVAKAQCGALISTFPYTENFEAAPAWTSGGVNSDWAWGAPTHPTISSAGGGTKCWNAGGLSGSFYNFSEQAWIQSPCFDFSTLNYPWITFKIFWEDEWKYDGLVLQSSIDGGTTWVNVGAFGDPVNCLNDHWYDYGNITWLNSLPAGTRQGWTGRTGPTVGSCQGGNGSLGWVTAKHCMSSLANQPSVKFRFLFGSGTTCNSYDGISIDDIFIDNAPPNVANFTYACAGANTVNFTNASLMCPSGYYWDFGDGATSTLANPNHIYAGPGTYNVTLISSGPCNASGSITIPVTILGVNTFTTNVTCNGMNNGAITTNVLGGAGTYTYSWTPGGATTSGISGLTSGTYSVNISAAGSCPTSATVTVTQPTALTVSTTTTPVSCYGGSNGTATVLAIGGTAPYAYAWTPSSESTSMASGLSPGNYTVIVTDANRCTTSATAIISQPTQLAATISSTSTSCGYNNGTATISVAGGTPAYIYSWAPSGGTVSTPTNLPSGIYTATITDANGCVITSTTTIATSTGITATINATPPLCYHDANASANATATGGSSSYNFLWSTAQTGASITNIPSGNYCVYVTDVSGGCADTICTTIVDPPQVIANFSNDPSITDMSNPDIHFTDLSNGATNWIWNFGDTTTSNAENPIHTYGMEGNYPVILIATNANGCSDTVIHTIIINDGFTFFAPNAFTPDGDGVNDIFLPKGADWDPTKFDLWIFDRWGNSVFHTSDMNKGWNGNTKNNNAALMDVYVWKVQLSAITGQKHEYLGSVTTVQ